MKIDLSNKKMKFWITDALDNLILISYSFLIIFPIVGTAQFVYQWPSIITLLRYRIPHVVFVIAVCKSIFAMKEKNRIIAILLLVMALICKKLGLCDYLFVTSFMVAFANIDFERCAKVYVATVGMTLMATLICSLTGFIPNYYIFVPGREEMYYTLGFGGHNAFMAYWMFVALALLYLYHGSKRKIAVIVSVLAMTFLIHYATDSHTGMFLISFVSALMLADLIVKNYNKELGIRIKTKIAKVLIGTPIYSLVITIAGVFFYNKYQRTLINNTVISRFHLVCSALERLGIMLPYQTISSDERVSDVAFNWITGTGVADFGAGDNLFGNLLTRDGLMILVPFLAIQVYIMYRAYQKREYLLVLICAIINIYCIFESVLLDIAFTLFFMVIFANLERGKSAI